MLLLSQKLFRHAKDFCAIRRLSLQNHSVQHINLNHCRGRLFSDVTSLSTERWIEEYSSRHLILCIGDGDFSFSLCIASALGSAVNITATSLDSYDTLVRKYKKAGRNIYDLQSLGARVVHGIDAKLMASAPAIHRESFDRIVYNFPHSGAHGPESDIGVIRMHQDLMRGFFGNARQMLTHDGEVHVRHKDAYYYRWWDLEGLAGENSLSLKERNRFFIDRYPGYNVKRTEGINTDVAFFLGSCSTYKFILASRPNPKVRKECARLSGTTEKEADDKVKLLESLNADEKRLHRKPGFIQVSDSDRLSSFLGSYTLGVKMIKDLEGLFASRFDAKVMPEHLLPLCMDHQKFKLLQKSAHIDNFYKVFFFCKIFMFRLECYDTGKLLALPTFVFYILVWDSNSYEIFKSVDRIMNLKQRILVLLNEWDDHSALQKILDTIEMLLALPVDTPSQGSLGIAFPDQH